MIPTFNAWVAKASGMIVFETIAVGEAVGVGVSSSSMVGVALGVGISMILGVGVGVTTVFCLSRV